MRCIFQLICISLFVACVMTSRGAGIEESYSVEPIRLPADAAPEVGAITFDEAGMLYVLLRRGDVIRAKPAANPQSFLWQAFAAGFHNAIGLVAPSPTRVVVSQMGELTEATDTDADGLADQYRVITDDWGLSGNYHEANALCSDGRGGYFLGLGTASHSGPTFVHTKGEFSRFGRRGRNYSGVAYRGWIMHVAADGKLKPFASGFRMQNGLLADEDGNLWSGDNQGDWKAATPLYHVQQGKFYGHPSSLVWDPRWEGKDPLATFRHDLESYNALRTRPAVEMPHLELCRSAGEPVVIPRDGSFGPFGGQMLIPDVAGARLVRIMLEKVEGEFQGAATLFISEAGMRTGNGRLRFSPDGEALYIGRSVRGWGKPSEGLDRVTWRGHTPFTIERMEIIPSGFRLTFTAPPNDVARSAAAYVMRSMIYQPRWTYGSAPEDVRHDAITEVRQVNERTVEILLASLAPSRIYHLQLGAGIKTSSQAPMMYRDFYYTANRVPG